MHKKALSLFTKIWALIALVILAMTIGCSDTRDPTQLNPGVHKINHHSFFINSLGMQFVPFSGKKISHHGLQKLRACQTGRGVDFLRNLLRRRSAELFCVQGRTE